MTKGLHMNHYIENRPQTLMEVFKILPEGTLAELIDNQLYMSPSPIHSHQRILKKIAKLLDVLLEDTGKGEVIISPFDIFLDETRNAVQPDIIVILNENKGHFTDSGHFSGVPDLLIEILSDGNKNHDKILKKDLYEQFGVQEYWMIEPDTKLCLVYYLVNNKYQKISEGIGSLNSQLLNKEILF